MAWTAPRTWTTGEIVTASMLNTDIRDNLRYMKGLDGDVRIEDDLAIGSATGPISTVAGRNYVTVKGSTSVGALELATSQADGEEVPVGVIQWTDVNSVASDKRIANMVATLSGATANNRGGRVKFAIKPDGGTLMERLWIEPDGRLKFTLNRQGGDATNWFLPGTINYVEGGVFLQAGSAQVDFGAGSETASVWVTLPVAFNGSTAFLFASAWGSTEIVVSAGLGDSTSIVISARNRVAGNLTGTRQIAWLFIGK